MAPVARLGPCVPPGAADRAPRPLPLDHTPAGSDGLDKDNFEFVAPTKVYVVNRGQITVLDLMQLPALTPRQIEALARVDGLLGAPNGMSK